MDTRKIVAVILSLGLLAASCGEPAGTRSTPEGSPSETVAPLSDDQLYEGTGLVYEDPKGTILCLGGVNDSLPPQCGGPKLRGWSWKGLDYDEAAGARWGTYTVRGTYVDGVFTLEGEPQVPEPYDGDGDSIVAPCDEPAGGWEMPEPERTTEEDRMNAIRAAEAEPDSSGVWIDYIEQPMGEEEMQPWGTNIILVLAFTGEAERHEVEAREHWGGALCIWIMDRTEKELATIQRELGEGWPEEMGIETTWSDRDITMGIVHIGVIVSTPAFEAEVDERYGDAVVVRPALHPVD